jgi:hypothetical protein
MTPHQFRHYGATSYLEQHPEDFETAREMLGHAWTKTTRIYAGSSGRRASRAYNQHLLSLTAVAGHWAFFFIFRQERYTFLPIKRSITWAEAPLNARRCTRCSSVDEDR